MSKAVIVKREIAAVWREEIQITLANAKACKLAYNTLKSAVQSGICTTGTMSKLNKFLEKQREYNNKIISGK